MNAVVDTEVQTSLDAIREQIASLTADLHRLGAERDRCLAEAERHRKVVDALPLARAALADLHERRTCGEHIPDKQIEQIEENLRNAQTMADRAELAEKGARAAAQRFTDQQQPIVRELATARAQARAALATMLRERAEESRAQYQRDAESFVRTAHARHHATINAIALMAQNMGLGDVSAIPCPPSGLVEFIGTGTNRDPDAAFVIDARPAIAAATPQIAAELQQLIV